MSRSDSERIGTGPLAGYRVLELGSTVAGPFCGRLLADFGAEVIKVELPTGDTVRSMGKSFRGHSLYAASIFRNKSLIAIDLHDERGQDLVRRLAAESDVVVENFRPGRMEEWGLGYSALAEDNPGLVMVRISGFGQDGPYRNRPGYGVIGEAVSGLRYLTGDPDRPPSRVAVSMTDYITGLYAAFGTTLALIERERTGLGQVVDAALYESAFSFTEPWIPAYEKLGHVAERSGSRLPESTPNNLYPTKDDSFIQITAPSNGVFARLAEAMGMPELTVDSRFEGPRERSENHEAIDGIIASWTGGLTLSSLEERLNRHDIPYARVNTMADVFEDPHFTARGNIENVPHTTLDTVAMASVVPRLSDTPGAIRRSGGGVGQDTRDVLHRLLKIPQEEFDRLLAEGVIGVGGVEQSE